MIQLSLIETDPPALVQAAWEQFDPTHREALTRRLALVIAKVVGAPAVAEDKVGIGLRIVSTAVPGAVAAGLTAEMVTVLGLGRTAGAV